MTFNPQPKKGMPEKKKPKPLKRSPIKRKYKPTGEKNLFEEKLESLSDDQETVCFVCGERIALLMPHNFSHVLSKGRYPLFRLKPENIVLLCHRIIADENGNGCHNLYDASPHSELKGEGWERLFALREELKKEYKRIEKL